MPSIFAFALDDDSVCDVEFVELLGESFEVRRILCVQGDSYRARWYAVGAFSCCVNHVRNLNANGEIATDDDVVDEFRSSGKAGWSWKPSCVRAVPLSRRRPHVGAGQIHSAASGEPIASHAILNT